MKKEKTFISHLGSEIRLIRYGNVFCKKSQSKKGM